MILRTESPTQAILCSDVRHMISKALLAEGTNNFFSSANKIAKKEKKSLHREREKGMELPYTDFD